MQTTYQCPSTFECKNEKCFWKQRDCFGRESFPLYFDENGKTPGLIKNNEISKKYGDPYFPKHSIEVGTNCMYIVCEDFISESIQIGEGA